MIFLANGGTLSELELRVLYVNLHSFLDNLNSHKPFFLIKLVKTFDKSQKTEFNKILLIDQDRPRRRIEA